jgi:amino acid adenylation domain-containing protein
VSLADRLSALTPEQRAAFDKLRREQRRQAPPAPPRAPQPPPIARRPSPEGSWPLSFDQERLWFLYTLNPRDTAYNVDTASRLRGALDVAALRRAFQEIPRRHEAWRTVFPAVEGRPVQVVRPEMPLPLEIVDLRDLPSEDREAAAHRLMVESVRVPFVLEEGPLARALLLRLDDAEHVVHLVVQHIVTDWVTFQLFWRELGRLYEAFAAGHPSPLPPPAVQYADYALWQRDWMRGEVQDYFLRYWTGHLRGAPLALEIPTDRPRPPMPAGRGVRVPVRIERAAELKALARHEGLTPFMAVLAAYQLVLARWSGQERVIVGSPNANRNRMEIEEILGFFLTQLPFCTDVSGDPTLREALRRTRDVALAAYAHQDLPFGQLVEALHPERDLSRAPIIQVILLVLDGAAPSLSAAGLELEPLEVDSGSARYEATFALWDHPDRLEGWYEVDADLWDRTTAARLMQAFEQVLGAMLDDPESHLSEVAWLTPAARHQLLAEWNDTVTEYPTGVCLHELVAVQARRTPEAIAVVFEEETLTYRELHHRARELATHLARMGVGPEARVGVRMERSLDLVVALLGVLEAGAAYVPLEPGGPEERLRVIREAAGLAVVLEAKDGKVFKDTKAAETGEPLESLPSLKSLAPLPANAAYTLFTSGSTGTPKGVVIPHRGIVNRLLWMQQAYGLTSEDRVLQKTPFGFDVSVWEFFWPLLIGARLVLARPEGHKDPVYLARLIRRAGITTTHFVPSMLQLFLETPEAAALPSLRRVMASGEALPPELVRRFHATLPGVELHNLYGPTEASVDVSFWPTEPAAERVPIGRPIANLRLHVMDAGLRLQPVGVPGELLLGGVGLARGYLGRPELTAAAFIPDPFGGAPGERLYRTGDLVRTLPDGTVEFLGRIDHQVKIRGVRIELGEVEATLAGLPGVRECVVVARDGALVAYVAGSAETEDLRQALLERLPEAFVPSAFVYLEALPLTSSGKVDRRALPAPGRPATTDFVVARTPDEAKLAALWCAVLGVERVGLHDHFFVLGGHSLRATRLTLQIREAFGVDLPVRAIFQAPTLAEQAERIAALRAAGATVDSAPIPRLPRAAWPLTAPLSFAQERLWLIDRLMPGTPAYNLAVALRLDGPLDVAALGSAFDRLVERHETLRTAFPEREGRPVQEVVAAPAAFPLPVSDCTEADVLRRAEADALRPFDLSSGHPLRASLLRLGPERHVLLVALHHIVADAWSLGVLVEDLTALYAGRTLPELPVQYADYAVWQRETLTGEEIERQLAFWRGELAGAPRILDLPTDRPRPLVQSLRGGLVPFAVDAASTAALRALAQRAEATLYMVLLAGWSALLSRVAHQPDLVVGTTVANRDRLEVERLIGFFINTLALRVDLTGEPGFAELVGRLRRRVLDAFAHRDLPFEKLVEELQPVRDRSRQPLFQAVLTLQNVPRSAPDLGTLTLTPLEVQGQTAKFDLTLTLVEQDGGLQGSLEYAGDLWDRATIERWAGAFVTLLASAVKAAEDRVAELPLLTEAERRELLAAPRIIDPGRHSLPHLFEAQVDRAPDAPALSLGGRRLTYRELDAQANRLACHLRAAGVCPGDRVALHLERSFEQVVALLAVLKTGAAYVPLDPAWPAERLAFAREDSGATLLIDAAFLEREAAAIAGQSTDRLDQDIDPELPAYVIYTSGSTGRPKGVVVPHANVIRLFAATAPWFGFSSDDVWALFHSYAFDFSVWEIWGALLHGGRLVIVPFLESRTPEAFLRLLEAEGVTVLNQTPSAFRQLAEAPSTLRWIIFGGEALDPTSLEPWFDRRGDELPRLVNMYGITETTVHVTFRPLARSDAASSASRVGVPIPDQTVRVLDRHMGLLPAGVPGEICVGGAGLAQGYLNRPELTAERFVPDPFSLAQGARLYRSGDLARRLPDGDLEILGRIDQQVKIRGFRIEPGEIEAALARHPAVRQAVVLPRDSPAGKLLAACVAVTEPVPAADLQRFLRERLPEVMVPAVWSFLEELPLTANGKVDRRALMALEGETARAALGYVAPRTPLEERLVETVAGVLGLAPERVGIYDNFFDLGGHSLLATQMVAQIRLRHGIEVPLDLLFDSAHLADLADRVTERELDTVDDALLEEMLAELEGSS